jgi:hypothetical protein
MQDLTQLNNAAIVVTLQIATGRQSDAFAATQVGASGLRSVKATSSRSVSTRGPGGATEDALYAKQRGWVASMRALPARCQLGVTVGLTWQAA